MTSSIKRLRNRSPQRARSTRQGGQWSPAYLGPYAWYDANIGGSSSGITDSSANARAAMTLGATTAAPLWLPYTEPSVHLEAATAGTNSLSCTAPVGTASYSAAPRGGGAPTTGAASAGAFTFSTAGDWSSISLLTAGSAEVARFRAADCTQSGVTDSYGVAWVVNRGTTGRKTVVQSSTARSAGSMFLLGTDDYLLAPAAAVPSMGVGAQWTFVVVFRLWGTTPSFARVIDSSSTGATTTAAGLRVLNSGTATGVQSKVADGTTGVAQTLNCTLGTRTVLSTSNTTGDSMTSILNGTSSGGSSIAALGSRSSGLAVQVGRSVTGNYNDMEFQALLTFSTALSAADVALISSYYGGGL